MNYDEMINQLLLLDKEKLPQYTVDLTSTGDCTLPD